MLQGCIFLGFLLTAEYVAVLETLSPQFRRLFIGESSDYLQEWSDGEATYLGKWLPPVIDLVSLEMLESNIYSLLKRLTPEYSYEKGLLWLCPVGQYLEN